MNYQVLARKWRPRSFQQMVGQEHILRMLVNALDNQRLHHAYLFTGTRGVGKTSLARLLAKCLNCETGITSTPCDTCSICQSIDTGRFLDLIEVDAASRTKVEDTRELLENVQYAPTQGRFKIYLIDEVHMLSGHSFNALLKTLEEPPEHVKFLLATTDPKRLPITILSRCLQFNLKRVPLEQITQQLSTIATAENITFELPALTQLAQAADGSMRDALSLLDQAIAFCRNNIAADDIRRMLGNIEQDYIFRLLHALAENNGKKMLDEITALTEQAPDFSQVLENLLSVLHQISVTQIVDIEPAHTEIKQLAAQFTPEVVQLYYQIALLGRRDLPLAPRPAQGFEMVMIRMLAFQPETDGEQITPAGPKTVAKQPVTPSSPAQKTPTVAEKKPSVSTSDDPWINILSHLKLSGMGQALASNCTLDKMTDNTIDLLVSTAHAPMLNPKIIERIEEAVSQHLNKPMTIHIKQSTADLNTAAKQHDQNQKAKLASAVETITGDNQVQKIVDLFNATLDISSIKALDPQG
jgi:DNA polymerase-3 subunit gamma/tau